ncbi:MAG TPA: hypothetical protein VL326_22940 [Kofleriaceae bacterium]|nr:hypothetical protein [Kofleriaceae bacterium]
MMRRALAVLLVIAGCLDESSATTDFEGIAKVNVMELPASGPEMIDILFVLDNSAAIAPYLDRMATLPAAVANGYTEINDGLVNAHIAVVTSSGWPRTGPGISDAYVAMSPEFDFTWVTNYEGTLVDRLSSLMTFDATDVAPNRTLATIAYGVDRIAGFHRENASLGIVIVSASDDSSPDDPLDYARRLKGRFADPASIIVSRITSAPTPRLDAFTSAFPYRNKVLSFDDADYTPAIATFANLIRVLLGARCWHASDVDLETPGPQYDCTVTLKIRDTERVLPPCRLPGEEFCWSVVPGDKQNCIWPPEPVDLLMPPYRDTSFMPAFRAECVVFD